jgi:hypothetical protein
MFSKHPLTLKDAARALRLRYQVVKRMAQRGRIRAEVVSAGTKRFYVVDGDDLPRVRRLKPWRTDAMRRFRYP